MDSTRSTTQHRHYIWEMFSGWRGWVVPILLTLFLVSVSNYNFLLFHTLAELFAIVVAIILSVVVWHTYSFSKNHFLMFLGAGYFWIGILDLMHTLNFKGMGIFEAGGPNVGVQFWIATRYMEALMLLSAPYFFTRKINGVVATTFFGSVAAIVCYSILSGSFPVTFVDGVGLTPFKVVSEYIIVAILLLAILLISKYRKLIDRRIYVLMVAAILLTMASELTFTLYVSVYSAPIVVGHILKLFSFWMIFVAVVRTTLTEPYQIMARASSTYDAIPDPTIVVDEEGIISQVNNAACKVTRLPASELLEHHCHGLFHPQDVEPEDCVICEHIRLNLPLHSREIHFAKSNEWKEFTLTPFDGSSGFKGMVHVSLDITSRKQAEAGLIHQANFDSLTNYPNRNLAVDRLDQAMKRAARFRKCTALMFIDLDNFKNINDTLGHAFGDNVLIEAAERLSQCVRDSDTVARWGGDEFLVVLQDLNSLLDSEHVADKILEKLHQPFVISDREFVISASVGITGYPHDGDDTDTLLSNADAAMYRAKEAGKNTFRYYTQGMNQDAARRMEMESLLHHAIVRNELEIVYQPKINVSSGEVIGAEALLRWHNPKLGNVSPEVFIPLAEDSGLILPIGEWVLNKVCEEISSLADAGFCDQSIAINISSLQLKKSNFIKKTTEILKQHDIATSRVTLEITESLLLEDYEENIELLYQLSKLGFNLSLDDFGTGYSSLSYLKRFPFSEIKIDRSFVSDITVDPGDAELCKAIIAMAQSLKLDVVGEGVETREQLAFLSNNGAHIMQGYYFSKPVPLQEFVEYFSNSTKETLSV